VLNISRFISRPGTKAAEMKEQVSGGETKERSTKMTSTFDWVAFESNKKWRNWQGEIIIDEVGKDNTFVGRNPAYKPVIVSGNYVLGQTIKVKVTNITKYDLRAEEVIGK
jgi:tRNA A37 methylthiotransferase MiaB